jgi:predicted nucleotidyltransferase
MLKPSNKEKILTLFLDSPLEKFQLREISRITTISTPSVKQYLEVFLDGKLIQKEVPKSTYPQYSANRENPEFKLLKVQRVTRELQPCITHLDNSLQPACIILFGSTSKGEDIETSDIDLFVQTSDEPKDLRKFEKKLNKKINLLVVEEFKKLSPELKNNLVNGILLKGYLEIWD